jgi:hypothetical protein
VVRALDRAGALVDDVEVRQPSLDDVFFALTGRPAATETETGSDDPVRQPNQPAQQGHSDQLEGAAR